MYFRIFLREILIQSREDSRFACSEFLTDFASSRCIIPNAFAVDCSPGDTPGDTSRPTPSIVKLRRSAFPSNSGQPADGIDGQFDTDEDRNTK